MALDASPYGCLTSEGEVGLYNVYKEAESRTSLIGSFGSMWYVNGAVHEVAGVVVACRWSGAPAIEGLHLRVERKCPIPQGTNISTLDIPATVTAIEEGAIRHQQ